MSRRSEKVNQKKATSETNPEVEEFWKIRMDTFNHIEQVQGNMAQVIDNLRIRALDHDQSKLHSPEVEGFWQMAEELKLADTEYGSDEYRAILREYKDSTIGHHYAHNDHHPEHFPTGYFGMNLLQKLEMLADWYAATRRMKGGNLLSSIRINAARFGYDDYEADCLIATARELGWITDEPGVSDVQGDDARTPGSGG